MSAISEIKSAVAQLQQAIERFEQEHPELLEIVDEVEHLLDPTPADPVAEAPSEPAAVLTPDVPEASIPVDEPASVPIPEAADTETVATDPSLVTEADQAPTEAAPSA